MTCRAVFYTVDAVELAKIRRLNDAKACSFNKKSVHGNARLPGGKQGPVAPLRSALLLTRIQMQAMALPAELTAGDHCECCCTSRLHC